MLKRKVSLLVEDRGGNIVLDSTGLRVDFDIRLIPEFSRATFTVYNLNDATVRSIINGDCYATLTVQVGGEAEVILAKQYAVNNAVDEINLPDRTLKLFCFDRLKGDVLEEQVQLNVPSPTLVSIVDSLLNETSFEGKYEFLNFPKGVAEKTGPRPARALEGSIASCLAKLGKEYDFETYTIDGGFKFMYKPNLKNVKHTALEGKEPDVILQTDAMQANPKISIAALDVTSNLDQNIKPTTVLDISQLLTAGSGADDETLQLVDDYNRLAAGYQLYQTFSVAHKGSNYLPQWTTVARAYSPTEGKQMPTTGAQWAQRVRN